MFVLGLDIGYSNLKLAFGDKDGEMTTKVLPVGAGLKEFMPRNSKEGLNVLVNGKQWVAGVEPAVFDGLERELHSDYKSTDEYMALFYAALLLTEKSEIDKLVTGLPVDQAITQEECNDLIARLKGTHQITPKHSVNVKEVVVVPQPAGAYMDIVMAEQDEDTLEIFENGRTVVIDPGFYSVDWVVVVNGEIYHRSSGTSLNAMSKLLEEAARLIGDDYGSMPKVESIEKAVRNKKPLFAFAKKVELDSYLAEASKVIAKEALTKMRQTLRDNMNIDIVLLAGGGAPAYEEEARKVFPKSKVIYAQDHVLSNARGFWHYG